MIDFMLNSRKRPAGIGELEGALQDAGNQTHGDLAITLRCDQVI